MDPHHCAVGTFKNQIVDQFHLEIGNRCEFEWSQQFYESNPHLEKTEFLANAIAGSATEGDMGERMGRRDNIHKALRMESLGIRKVGGIAVDEEGIDGDRNARRN